MKAYNIKIEPEAYKEIFTSCHAKIFVELDTIGMKPNDPQIKLKWSKNKEFCPTCRGTGRIQEMVVDNIAKKVLFFTDARCPECNGTNSATDKS